MSASPSTVEVSLRGERDRWRFVSRGPGGEQMGQSGTFVDVDAPRLLVATEIFDDQSYPGTSLITRDLVDHDGVTRLTTTLRLPTRQARDRVLRYPMVEGFGQSCERLAALLAETSVDRRDGGGATGIDDGGGTG